MKTKLLFVGVIASIILIMMGCNNNPTTTEIQKKCFSITKLSEQGDSITIRVRYSGIHGLGYKLSSAPVVAGLIFPTYTVTLNNSLDDLTLYEVIAIGDSSYSDDAMVAYSQQDGRGDAYLLTNEVYFPKASLHKLLQ